MVTINVKNDCISDVQSIIDICEGDSRSLECRVTLILAKKLLGAIKQTDNTEFTIELKNIELMEVVVEGDTSSETIQSTENADEHLEKECSNVVSTKENSTNNKNK